MRYSDYLRGGEQGQGLEEFARLYNARNSTVHRAMASKYAASNPQALDQLLSAAVHARAEGKPLQGSFPIVLYAGGAYNSFDENVVLAEYLASHGFVVAAIPAQHARTISGPPDALGVEAQARDMESALSVTRQLPNADKSRVAAAGFSIGGAAALLMAMRNSDVDAVVALDSSITSEQYSKGLTSSPYYEPQAFRAPLLDIRAVYPEGSTHVGHVLEALRHSDRYSFIVPGFDHADFNNYAVAFDTVAAGSTKKGRSLPQRRGMYEAMSLKVLQFLKGTLIGDRKAAGEIPASMSSEGGKLADVLHVRALSPAPTPAELLHLIRTDGFSGTVAVLDDVAKRDPKQPVLAPSTLNAIGYTLLGSGNANDAIAVFRYNLARNPDDLGLRDSLAEGLLATNKACAAKEYAAIAAFVAAKGSAASDQERALGTSATEQMKVLPPAARCLQRQ